jgi:hypothetical protein
MKKLLVSLVILGSVSGCAVYEPAYVQPRPVYVQPAPIYVQPRPVYVVPPRRPHCYNETYYNRYNNTQTTRRVCR